MSYKFAPTLRDRKTYEWDLEACDGDEVLGHDFRDALRATDLDIILYQFTNETLRASTGSPLNLVLVQDIGNDDDGIRDRGWAYVTFNRPGHPELPSHFDNGETVPHRFQKHLHRWAVKNGWKAATK
tara:strand:+ start:262 stop:642 length:381 start_codon:yes stop_codon:yes gene_type:complete